MKNSLIVAVFLSSLFIGKSGLADVSRDQVTSPEDIVYAAKDWKSMYDAYKRLGVMSDGVVAGAFVDQVSMLLDEQWRDILELNRLASDDKRFRYFILHQLKGEAVPGDRAKRIKENADMRCPSRASQLCRDISHLL